MADCFQNVVVETKVHLLPSRLANVTEGVNSLFTGLLLKYSPQVAGVIMAFDKVKVLDTASEVFFDRPHIHLRVQARLLVFRPCKGAHLTGVVTKVEPDHVGVIVAGVFNATIKAQTGLPAEFEYVDAQGEWVSAATNEAIRVGTQLRFKVVKIIHFMAAVSFEGAMLDNESGFVTN